MNIRIAKGRLLCATMLLVGLVFPIGSVSAFPPQDSATPMVSTKSLPDGQVGKNYFQVIEAEGGKVPWSFSQTACPNGISFDTVRGPNSTDTLHGIPTEAGDFNVVITVTDSANPPHSSSTTLKLHINPK